MEKKFKRTTVTSALPYANGPVHIGHLAGVYVPADIYVRYLRLKKEDVIFIGGSDEHGVPITIRAKKEGITPQDVVDRYHTLIKKSFEEFGVSFDVYSRTTSKTHHDTASDFFRKLYDKGEFIEKTSMQYYDEEAKTFLADRYITGECPHCHAEGAYGDQCEKCGTSLSPTDLINPKSAISGSQPVMRETKHWYLPLDKHEEWLRQWILEDHKEWRPNVYGQCKSWLDMGLQPRAVSRDLDWGIPVPVEGAEGKVLYVWFDAPIGYISNTKELLPDTWEKWWKDPETRLVHFIGKDNIVFHCIVFPAMLKAEGSYILPDNVPSNEFLNLEGDKISTSRNWAVWLHEYLVDFPGKQDVLRYVLTANAPETKDNDFTWKDFQARNNNELVAVYGNFVNRALQLTKKYFDSVVPAAGELNDYDRETLKEFADVKAEVEKLLDVFKFRDAQKEAMNLARIGNKYLADTEPWKLAKTDMERVATILHISLQLVANLAIAFEPFLPFSSEKLRKMLNMDSFDWAELGHTDLLPAGHQLGTPEHHDTASDFFRKLYDKGEFIEKTSMQYYDEEAKTFLADRYITGECPHCHAEGAYGDQCEKCGTSLSPTDLINPKSAISGSQPVMRETKHWYLPLDKHEEWLRQWILEDHKEWRPNVYGQCKSWLDMGLQPRAVSRDLDWGIPVPVEGAEGKVLYVWFDAPIGYISNTKELLPDTWEKWWKDPETRLVHFIGKDNIVFHCIVFPAMLKAEGSYILPDNVPSNEFLNLEGDKISTSRNWAVWLHEYLVDFPGKQDVLRYVLTANAPETKDNDFTWKDFQARNNNELVAVYGNFVNRALQLTKKYFDSVVPAAGELNDYDRETLKEFADVKAEVEKLLDVFKFRDAQKEAMNLARIGNKYLADTEPWKLAKTDMERVATILHISLQLVANLAIAFEPFLPFSSEKLRKMLNMDSFDWAELGHTDLLPAGHQLGTPELLFEKIEDDVIQAQVDKLLATKKANEAATYKANPIKPTIAFEDFEKLDIRVGTVLECEAVPKMKKLLKFKIADGLENRTIVSGIAQHYKPEELVGKQVLFIANLAPRQFKNGLVSEGMILSAENYDGSLAVTSLLKEVKPGSEVK